MQARTLLSDLFASIVVFLVALPLCLGIAIASGVPPAAGIITGIVGGIIVGMFSGCRFQISGPAAGLTVLVWQIVHDSGLLVLAAATMLAGCMQMLAAWLKLGQWFRAVSPAVVNGMLSGIGILIFAGQFYVMVDSSPPGGGLANLTGIPTCVS